MIQIVAVHMGLYKHWAILSDRFTNGKPMLISNTFRNGTVREEPWADVVGDRPYKVHSLPSNVPVELVYAKARNAINKVKYDLFQYNCEHFVHDTVSGVVKSNQLRSTLAIAGLSIGALWLLSKGR